MSTSSSGRRRTVAGVVTALVASATAVVSMPAAPAHAATVGSVVSFDLGKDRARDLALVDGVAFVSAGDAVDVYNLAGIQLAKLPGLPGVTDLVPSPDRDRLYAAVSGGSGIAVIDPNTRNVVDTIPTPACPTSLTIAQGRAFIAYGCDHNDTAVTSVSLDDHTPGPVLDANFYGSVTLSAGGDVLAIADAEGSPSQTGTYRVDAAGTFTPLASARLSQANDIAVSPDGTQLIATRYSAGYGVERWDTATMTALPGMDTEAYPSAVTWSADGSHILAGVRSEHPFWLFDASGVQKHQSVATERLEVLAGTANLAGTTTAALTYDYSTKTYSLLVGSTVPPAATRLTVTTAKVAKPGAPLKITVTSNRPRTPVTLTVTDATGTRKMFAETGKAGRVVRSLTATTSGTVTAAVDGNLKFTAATKGKKFTVAGVLSAQLLGSYRTAQGVRYFHHASEVHPLITFKPARTAVVTVKLQRLAGKKWATTMTKTFATETDGRLGLTFKGAPKTRFRIVASFTGDHWNSRAKDVATATFMVG